MAVNCRPSKLAGSIFGFLAAHPYLANAHAICCSSPTGLLPPFTIGGQRTCAVRELRIIRPRVVFCRHHLGQRLRPDGAIRLMEPGSRRSGSRTAWLGARSADVELPFTELAQHKTLRATRKQPAKNFPKKLPDGITIFWYALWNSCRLLAKLVLTKDPGLAAPRELCLPRPGLHPAPRRY